MSDMHILSGDGQGKWTVVFHFAVPDINNAVAVNYRTALINSGLGGVTQLIEGVGAGQIATAEKLQIEAGEVFEYVESLLIESGGTAVLEQRAMLRAQYARIEADVIDGVKRRLKYFGHTEAKA